MLVILLRFKDTYACNMDRQRSREFIVFSSQVSPFMYRFSQIIALYKILKSQKTR